MLRNWEVSGNLGGKDIAFIREMAGTYNHANTEGKLVYLDMTEANIVADGEYYLPNSSGKEYLPTENTLANVCLPAAVYRRYYCLKVSHQ